MPKLTLSTISSRYASVAALNANFQAIVDAIENTLSRDGDSPNAMSASLDMNSNRILNLPAPVSASEAARLQDVQDALAGGSAALISFTPTGGVAATTVQAAIAEVDAEKQPLDATLTALAGVTTAANKLVYATGSDTFSTTDLSAFARTVLDDTSAADARTTLGAAASGAATASGLTMATSRLLGRTTAATGAIEELSVGSGLSLAGGTLSVQAALFPGIQQGLTLSNNTTDATNDIDVAAGKAVDTTAAVAMTLASTMVKRLDANWAAGTGNGGRYSGAAIANTTYHVWLVAKASGADVDVYLNPSADASTVLTNLQAESGGASYLYVWRIGSILRESAAIVPFIQTRDEFLRKSPVLDVNITNSTTAAVTTTLSVPVGVKVVAFVNVQANGDGAGNLGAVYLSSLDVNDDAPSGTAAPLITAGSTYTSTTGSANQALVRTNTSAQIRRRTISSASATTRVATLGWIDASIYRS